MRNPIYTALSLLLAAWSAGSTGGDARTDNAIGTSTRGAGAGERSAGLSTAAPRRHRFCQRWFGRGGGERPCGVWRPIKMRLMFALAGSGEYLADVTVKLVDAYGDTVLDAVSDGPLFYARVPPGRYRITVASAGSRRRGVSRLMHMLVAGLLLAAGQLAHPSKGLKRRAFGAAKNSQLLLAEGLGSFRNRVLGSRRLAVAWRIRS